MLAREETLGYGFVGRGGPSDLNVITVGTSVADLMARCGFPASLRRNPRAIAAGMGALAPDRGEVWFYPGDASRAGRYVHLQEGRVTDVKIVH